MLDYDLHCCTVLRKSPAKCFLRMFFTLLEILIYGGFPCCRKGLSVVFEDIFQFVLSFAFSLISPTMRMAFPRFCWNDVAETAVLFFATCCMIVGRYDILDLTET